MKYLWILGNLYGKLMGWRLLAPFHHAVVNLSLHSLGYGNLLFNTSGEKWFIEKVLSKEKTRVVFDVGANVGEYSKLLLNSTDSKIFAFEPNPHSFIELSKLPARVVKLEFAVGDVSTEKRLHFNSLKDEKASIEPIGKAKNTVKVKMVTLKEIVEKYAIKEIDFVKIDTEGFEKEVLVGLGEITPKYIQFEYNINHLYRNTTLLEISSLLPGYSIYRLLPNGWLRVDPKKYLNNIFIFSNYVAVRDSHSTSSNYIT